MLLRTWMIMWKEFKQISRDPRMLGVAFGLPIIMLLIYGYAINFDVTHVRIAVYDEDRSAASRTLTGAFFHSEYFDLAGNLTNDSAVREALDHGQARGVLTIPRGFARDIAAGRTTYVQLLIDGSDSTSASTVVGYTNALLQQQSARISLEAVQRQGVHAPGALQPVDLRMRYWYNPELKSTTFTIPGLIAVILMMLAALLTSATVVRERERGTFELLIASPIRPLELMLGKLAPYILIAFGDVILVVLAAVLLFHIPLRGSAVLVLVTSAIFLTAALGIGLLVSTISESQQTAMMVAMLTTQLPSIILSGFVFPIRSMPPVIQLITTVIPATHFIRILRTVFLKGGGWSLVWAPTLYLVLFAGLMLGLSATQFKKKL